MYDIERTGHFTRWYEGLRDRSARDRIEMRLRRIRAGNLGDWKSVGEGVRELRIDHGPGYRLYFGMRENTVVILLTGGDEASQRTDILKAQLLWKQWAETDDNRNDLLGWV